MKPVDLELGGLYEIAATHNGYNLPLPGPLSDQVVIYVGTYKHHGRQTKYLFLLSKQFRFPLQEYGCYLFANELEGLTRVG